MRSILLIALGAVLCLAAEVGYDTYWKVKHPLGSITNSDYNLVQVASRSGEHLFDLHKGESRFLKYGWYQVTIPEANLSFTLWKNNRGFCYIHSGKGMPFVETDANCAVDDQFSAPQPVQTIATNAAVELNGKTNVTSKEGYFKTMTDPQTGQYAITSSDRKSVVLKDKSGKVIWVTDVIKTMPSEMLHAGGNGISYLQIFSRICFISPIRDQ